MRSPADGEAPPALIGAAVGWGAARLAGGAAVGNSHEIDARSLLLAALGLDEYAALLAREREPLPAECAASFCRYIAARAEGNPVAYILGWREFYGRRFKTTPAALIPRPDTETLVEAALRYLPAAEGARVLDLGAGCGAIGISLALHRPHCAVTMTDVSEQTLELARANAENLKAVNTRFFCGDWYAPLDGAGDFDVIVCNPPYVAAGDEHLQRGDLRFEPPLALVGGADGMDALAQVICHAPRMLRRGGVLLVEHGSTQAAAVRQRFAAAGFCGIRLLADLARLPRVTLAVLP